MKIFLLERSHLEREILTPMQFECTLKILNTILAKLYILICTHNSAEKIKNKYNYCIQCILYACGINIYNIYFIYFVAPYKNKLMNHLYII